jgi:hypothetical protein
MGMQGLQGLCSRATVRGRPAGIRRIRRLTIIMSSLLVWPALAGCSSFSSPLTPFPSSSSASTGTPNPYQTAAMPPSDANAPPPPAFDARASIYPQQSLVDFKGSTQPSTAADPTLGAYPQQPLFNGGAGPSPAAVPHPPTTYGAPTQSYSPPPGQQAYNAPAGAAVAVAPARTAAAVPANDDQSMTSVYPKQSLFDLFKGSTPSQTPNMPHPPATYTPSAQP